MKQSAIDRGRNVIEASDVGGVVGSPLVSRHRVLINRRIGYVRRL